MSNLQTKYNNLLEKYNKLLEKYNKLLENNTEEISDDLNEIEEEFFYWFGKFIEKILNKKSQYPSFLFGYIEQMKDREFNNSIYTIKEQILVYFKDFYNYDKWKILEETYENNFYKSIYLFLRNIN